MHVDHVAADIPRPWMNTMGGLPCPSLTTCNRATRTPLDTGAHSLAPRYTSHLASAQ